jgi:hypothetical protein
MAASGAKYEAVVRFVHYVLRPKLPARGHHLQNSELFTLTYGAVVAQVLITKSCIPASVSRLLGNRLVIAGLA